MKVYLPNPLPPSSNLFHEDPKEDFLSINHFSDKVINMIAHDCGIFFRIEGKEPDSDEVRRAYLLWAIKVLAVEVNHITKN